MIRDFPSYLNSVDDLCVCSSLEGRRGLLLGSTFGERRERKNRLARRDLDTHHHDHHHERPPTNTTTTFFLLQPHDARNMKKERSSNSRSPSSDGAETAMGGIKLEDSPTRDIVAEGKILRMGSEIGEEKKKSIGSPKAPSPSSQHEKSRSPSPIKGEKQESPVDGDAGDLQKPKLLRAVSSNKASKEKKPPALFDHLPDSTAAATSTFTVIDACIYSNKYIGDSGQDGEVMSCECKEEWGKTFFRPRIFSPSPLPASIDIILTLSAVFLFADMGFSLQMVNIMSPAERIRIVSTG